MLILLGMPIIQIILFGFAITTEVKNVRVAVFDPVKDQFTRRIIERIDANEYMNVNLYLNNSKELDEVFRKNQADLVVVFSDRFSDNFYHTGESAIQLVADATDPNMATTLAGYATNVITAVQQEELRGMSQQAPVIVPQIKMLYNPRMESSYNFVPGVMGLILMLICAMMTSISIVREKEMGTMEVLLVSPVRPIFVVISKAVPYFVLSCVNIATILLLSRFVLGVPMAGNLFLLIAVCMLYILVALSLGLLVSTLTQKQMNAILFSGMVLMMPVMLLSGMIFPVENMPAILQWISRIVPARWFIAAVRKVMIQGVGFTYIAKEMAILAAMVVVLLVVSTKKFKVRL
jgi:ABC-2 type transport system permease protein